MRYSNSNELEQREKALEYGIKFAIRKRGTWIFGIGLQIYLFFKDIPSSVLVSFLMFAGIWMVVGVLEGVVLEALRYRRLTKKPELYSKEISAFAKVRHLFDIRGWWQYWQSLTFKTLGADIAVAIVTGVVIIVTSHFYFVISAITGYSLGCDIFWIVITARCKKGDFFKRDVT